MNSLINADNTVGIWMVMCLYVVFAMYAERHWNWSKKYANACTLCLIGGAALCTVGILPPESPAYAPVSDYVAPLAIPMLLFNADLKKVAKQSGRMTVIFIIACAGVVGGAIIGSALLYKNIPEMHKVAALITGSQTGGAVNVAAMREVFGISPTMFTITYLADNIAFVITTFVMLTLPAVPLVRKFYKCSYPVNSVELAAEEGEEETGITSFGIIQIFGIAFAILFATDIFTGFVNGTNAPNLVKQLFGQRYLIITLISVILATAFPKFMGSLKGAYELGMMFLSFFFISSTVSADMKKMFAQGPYLFIFCGITFITQLAVLLGSGKIFGFTIEEMVICSNASLGGPSTAAAVAGAKGWKDLITPAVLAGVLGYILGNYFGVFVGNTVLNLFGV